MPARPNGDNAWRPVRARYPLNIRDLNLAHLGRRVLIPGRSEPWHYAGPRTGRRMYHTLDVTGSGLRRLPTAEERAQRCALVDPDKQ